MKVNHRFWAVAVIGMSLANARAAEPAPSGTSPLVTALAFAHRHADVRSLTPGRDQALKSALIMALAGKSELAWSSVPQEFDRARFRKFCGGESITLKKLEQLMRESEPMSRKALHEKVRRHADLLSTQFDMIAPGHHDAADRFAEWIVKNYKPGQPLGVIVICTGNTRRSMLGSTMGNMAAAYHGLPNVRFFSGGTEPSAINPRTIAALKAIGVEIEPTGQEAPRGASGDANPIYSVCWGRDLKTIEYSKKYTDAANPQTDFAAVLVCSEADDACPRVKGASIRLPVPYLDPKAYDGAEFEAAKYAERRDDIGRFMLNVMLRAKRQLEESGADKQD